MLARLAASDLEGAVRSARSAIEADSSNPAPLIDFGFTMVYLRMPPAVVSALERTARSGHPLALCARSVLGWVRGIRVDPDPRAPESTCSQVAAWLASDPPLSPEAERQVVTELRRLIPSSAYLAAHPSLDLPAADSLSRSREPLVQVVGLARAGALLHRAGRHREGRDADHRLFQAATAPFLQQLTWNYADGHEPALAGASGDLRRHREAFTETLEAITHHPAHQTVAWLRLYQTIVHARAHLDRGDLTVALALLAPAAALADSIGEPTAIGDAYLNLGRAAVKAADAGLAERSLTRAREAADRSGFVPIQYEVEHNLLHLYESQGRHEAAREAGLRFIATTGRTVLSPVRMMSHHDMGEFLRRRGEWEPAQHHFETMVATIDSLPQDYQYWAGEYFESIGDLERAKQRYLRIPDVGRNARAIEALARLAEATGDTAEAIRYAELMDRVGSVGYYPEHRPLLPGVLARSGRIAESISRFEEARRTAAGRGQRAAWARLTLEEAVLEYHRGGWARAETLADSGVWAGRDVGETEIVLRGASLAIAARSRGDRMPARVASARLRALRLAASRIHALALAREIAQLDGDVLAEDDDARPALARYAIAQDLADSVTRGLADEVARAGFRAVQLAPSDQAFALIVRHRNTALAATWWIEWSGRRKGTAARRVPRRTRSGEAQVDYVVTDSLVSALAITPAGARITVLPISARQLVAQIATLYARAQPRLGNSLDRSRARLDPGVLQALATSLLAPLEPLPSGIGRLVIIPDGLLSLVPFDLLPWEGGTLIDRYTVMLAPSLAEAPSGSIHLNEGPVVAILGGDSLNPVPGGVREIQAIEQNVRHRPGVVLRGPDATEEAVRRWAPAAAVLHFAAHARSNYIQPDLAEVQLAPDETHDGRLQAHEVRALGLDRTLVVLSACETVPGKVLRGEGPLGLARAFLRGGAGYVVATLWAVGESSAELMGEFHRRLDVGDDPPEALRHAKLSVRARGLDPRVWAPFSVFGSVRAAR